jgi:hypothetical protein
MLLLARTTLGRRYSMKKGTWRLVVCVATLLALVVPTVVAQGSWPSQPGTSGVTAVNMDTGTGMVAALYIAEDGTQYALPVQELDPGAAYTWYAEPSSESSFRGSVLLQSDVEIAAIGRTEWPPGGADGAASYRGQAEGAASVLLPQLVIEHYGTTSALTVQNTDLDNAIDVNLIFSPQGGSAFTETMHIEAGASTTYDMAFGGSFVDPNPGSWGWLGAAMVESPGDTPVVAVAHTTSEASGFVYAYDGFTDLNQDTVYAPLVRRNFACLTTGIGVADASGNGGTVQVEYVGFGDANRNYVEDAGESYVYTDTDTLAPGGYLNFYQNGAYHNDSGQMLPDRFLGSATITVSGSGAAIAAIVNDQTHPTCGGNQTASAYSGFFGTEGGATIVSPLARNEFYNFTTGISVQNIGGDAVDVDVAYTTSANSVNMSTPPTRTVSLDPGGATTFYLPVDWGSTAGEQKWLGSAEITASGSGDVLIVAITNDQDVLAPVSADTALFNCFVK